MAPDRSLNASAPTHSAPDVLQKSALLAFTSILLAASPAATPTSTATVSGWEDEETQELDLTSLTLRPARDSDRGSALFGSRCSRCHGPEGRGNGPIARFLDPRPTDLSKGVFKLRSTPTGHPPTEGDLFRTITRGIPGTGMLSWAGLSLDDRWQLVWHVQSLSSREGRLESDSIAIPYPPAELSELAARGAGVYQLMQCARCHGMSGRGDGRDAFQIKDDSGRFVRPFDFSRSWKLKSGSSPRALYRALWTGLDGTGMPSYGDALSEKDTWALVAFVRTLFVDTPGDD
ncbi:MAG: c-type cytochrome [Deltaproteobacteria bacterium]|nr:c-type cytochrome [Deltaproteobacteria bacterium]